MENQIDKSQEMHSALQDIGSLLYQERVKKGYRLEDISTYLKLSIHTLKAIEEGVVDSLPHLVYTKGFIRSYAQFLDIPEYELASIFHRVDDTEKIVDEGEDSSSKKKKRKHSLLYLWGVTLLFLCILAGIFVYYSGVNLVSFDKKTQLTDNKKEKLVSQKKEENHSNVSLSSPNKQVEENIQNKIPLLSQKASENFQQSQIANEDIKTSFINNNDVQLPVQSNEKTFSKGTDIPTNIDLSSKSSVEPVHMNKPGRKNIIVLKGLEDCWVHSTADTTETRQFYVQQGQLFALSFSKNLVLKLGNAGGIELKYNGKKLPPVGRSGQVKTISFPLVSQN